MPPIGLLKWPGSFDFAPEEHPALRSGRLPLLHLSLQWQQFGLTTMQKHLAFV
jgi:hypothetical protein